MAKNGYEYPLQLSRDGKNLGVYFFDEAGRKTEFIEVSPAIRIDNIKRYIDSNLSILCLSYNDGLTDVKFDVELSNLTSKDIIKILLKNSFLISDCYADSICAYILNLYLKFPKDKIQYFHTKLGFHHEKQYGTGTFFVDKAYNCSLNSTLVNNDQNLIGSIGDIEVYRKMIEKEVIPHINLQLVFVLGFVAPIIPLLSSKTSVDAIISNFSGISSSGKTTSLSLMASVWGSGVVSNRGMIKTFFSTNNCLMSYLNDRVGFPIMFDDYETGNETAWGLTGLLYQIAEGESKGRCDETGKPKNTTSWKTFVALSGESSIFERTVKKQGLLPRVLEFNDFAWTASKQNAENISSTCRTNYGFFGPLFVQELFQKVPQIVLEQRYDKALEKVEESIVFNNGVQARIGNKLAYIYLTAQLVKELLGFDIDSEKILELLVENETTSRQEHDPKNEMLNAIREYITSNASSFQTGKSKEVTKNYVGKIEFNKKIGKISISIMKETLNEFLVKKGFNDRLKLLKQLADMGYLKRYDDRLVGKPTIGFLRQEAYTFLFPFEEMGNIYVDYSPKKRVIVGNMPVCQDQYDDQEAIDEVFDEEN